MTSAVGSHWESADWKEITHLTDGRVMDGNCGCGPLRGAGEGATIIHHWKGEV